MKRLLSMLLMLCLLLGCFAGCNVAEKDPEGSSEQPSESQSESESQISDEWFLERRERSSSPTLATEREIVPIDQLPGTEIPYRVLSTKGTSQPSGATVFTEEEARDALAAVDVDANTVDFENEVVICVVTSGGMYEAHSIKLHKLLLLEQPEDSASTPPCMLFVYTTNYSGLGDGVELHYTTYLAIPKSALPQKNLQYLICGYSTEISGLGTAYMFPLFPEDVPEHIERVYFPQEEIPGARLEMGTVFSFEHTDILKGSSGAFRIFESKADLLQYIDTCDGYNFDSDKKVAFLQAVENVDFETCAVIATVATYASGEEPLTLDELILQDDRLVFVYESHFTGTTDQNVDHWSTLITVPKSELPNKALDGFICAYTYVDVDPNVFPVGSMKGSAYYFNYYEYR